MREDNLDETRRLILSGEGDVNCVTWTYSKGIQCYVKSHNVFNFLVDSGLIIDERTLVTFIQHGLECFPRESDFACEILQRLIDLGAPLEGSSSKKEIKELRQYKANRVTPLVECLFNDRLRFMEVLLKNGANPSRPDIGTTTHFTALHYWVMSWKRWMYDYNSHLREDALDLLLRYKTDTTCIDIHGDAPVHLAAKYRWCGPFEALIRRGACLFSLNMHGLTPLQLSVSPLDGELKFPRGSLDEFNELHARLLRELYAVDPESGEIARIQGA